MKKIITPLIGIILFSVVGCQTTDRGYVQREWSTTLRELGLVPVFPPREDIVIGDLYGYDYPPNDLATQKIIEKKWADLTDSEKLLRQRIGMSSRLARIDFNNEIDVEYRNTISAPATPAHYNSILGNQALAAANEAVDTAKTKKTALEDQVKALEQGVSAAETTLLQKRRAKENADRDVTRAQAKVDLGAATASNVTAAEAALVAAKQSLRDREDELVAANNAVADSTGTAQEAAKERQKNAQRRKEDAARAVTRADEDLTAAKARPELAASKADLAVAKTAQQTAIDAQTTAERDKADAESALAAGKKTLDPKIEAAGKEIVAAEGIRDAIAKAGEKVLYAQPRDPKKNVFTVAPLPDPSAAEDLENSRVNRLRLVGFPEFASVSFSQGDLAALIPIEAFEVGLGFSQKSVSRVSVKVPAAESYALSTTAFKAKLIVRENRGKGEKDYLKNEYWEALKFQLGYNSSLDRGDGANAYVRVVSEVFYARALDVSVFHSKTQGGRARVSPLGGGAVSQAGASQTVDPTGGVFPIDSGAAGFASAQKSLEQMQSQLGRTLTVPGGSVQMVSHNEHSVGVRRVFDRPVAIGTRGFILAVNLKHGTVVAGIDGGGSTMNVKE